MSDALTEIVAGQRYFSAFENAFHHLTGALLHIAKNRYRGVNWNVVEKALEETLGSLNSLGYTKGYWGSYESKSHLKEAVESIIKLIKEKQARKRVARELKKVLLELSHGFPDYERLLAGVLYEASSDEPSLIKNVSLKTLEETDRYCKTALKMVEGKYGS